MTNGEKKLSIENIIQIISGDSSYTSLGLLLDKGRHIISSEHRCMEVHIYIDFSRACGVCICMGHHRTIPNRKSIVSCKFLEGFSKINILLDYYISNIIFGWFNNTRLFLHNNLSGNIKCGSIGNISPPFSCSNSRRTSFQRMAPRKIKRESNFIKINSNNNSSNFCLISYPPREIIFDAFNIYPPRSNILSNKNKIQSKNKHGKHRGSFCVELICAGVLIK